MMIPFTATIRASTRSSLALAHRRMQVVQRERCSHLQGLYGDVAAHLLDERQIQQLVQQKALGAPREERLLMVDFASDTQALAKVRVRVNTVVFIDYLTYHRIDGSWLITGKGYHVEKDNAAERH